MSEPLSVLVIDDDDDWLDYCVTILAREGYRVCAASAGVDALPKLKTHRFDLVLTDHVPNGGVAIAEAVKAISPETEVIVMTAGPSVEDAVESLRRGAADYLGKPFSIERLRQAVRQCQRVRGARRPEAPIEGMGFLEEVVREVLRRALTDEGWSSRRGHGASPHLEPLAADLVRRAKSDFAHRTQDAEETRLVPQAGEFAPPSRLGRYEIIREIGRGNMGLVYLGRDPRLNRLIAVKVLPPGASTIGLDAEEARRRFCREAQCAARLSHPHIVKVFDAGEQDGLAYIAMELLQGRDLRSFTRREGLPEPSWGAARVAEAAFALDYAHAQGVCHRDVKPENLVILDSDRSLRVTDFGIASLPGAEDSPGAVVGTPRYMSPERIAGGRADGRADQFSLGVVLFELLCGQSPWLEGASLEETLHEVANRPHRRLREVNPALPEDLAVVVDRALAKDPALRYPSCAAFAEALSPFLAP